MRSVPFLLLEQMRTWVKSSTIPASPTSCCRRNPYIYSHFNSAGMPTAIVYLMQAMCDQGHGWEVLTQKITKLLQVSIQQEARAPCHPTERGLLQPLAHLSCANPSTHWITRIILSNFQDWLPGIPRGMKNIAATCDEARTHCSHEN